MEVPTHTADYVMQLMQKLYTPTPKWLATEMDTSSDPQGTQTTSFPRQVPKTYSAAAVPITPTVNGLKPIQTDPTGNTEVQDLKAKTEEHSSTLKEVQKCCANLAASQQQMATNMATLNTDMNVKFSELVDANKNINECFNQMSVAIESLRPTSPRPNKLYKDIHGLPDVTFQG
jgi:ABC-type transporter Mla subunit MlaD